MSTMTHVDYAVDRRAEYLERAYRCQKRVQQALSSKDGIQEARYWFGWSMYFGRKSYEVS